MQAICGKICKRFRGGDFMGLLLIDVNRKSSYNFIESGINRDMIHMGNKNRQSLIWNKFQLFLDRAMRARPRQDGSGSIIVSQKREESCFGKSRRSGKSMRMRSVA